MRSSCVRPTTRLRASLAVLAVALVSATAPDDAAKTLDAVQKRYDSVHDLRASFAQTSYSAALGKETATRGSVVVKRPGMMRWEYAKPDGRVIVLDGKSIRIWNPEDKQLQIAAISSSNVSPTALGFLMGQGVLRDSFEAKTVSEPNRSDLGLLLHPKGDAGFESLTLWLDARSLQLRESVVVDLFGNRTRVSFESTVENGGVEPSAFELAAPDGAEVIDLR